MTIRGVLAIAFATLVFGATSRSLADPEHAEPNDKGRPDDKGEHHGKRQHRDKEGDKDKPDDKGPPGLAGRADDRHAKLLERFEERKKTVAQRRQAAHDEIRRHWGNLVDLPPARDELRLHAMRTAKLERIKELAEADGKTEVVARASAALERERARHEKRMEALRAGGGAPAASASGGAP